MSGIMKHTYDECYEVAKKYERQNDFIKNDPAIFYFAYRRGWLKDYTWIKKRRETVTIEECVNAALECDSVGEFRDRFPREYRYALRNKMLEDFDWIRRSKWDYDTVAEESRKYKTRSEFSRHSNSAYNIALRNKWIDGFTWLNGNVMDADKLGKVYNIYGLFDDENMVCHIYASRYSNYESILKRKKLVYNHFAGIGKDVPEPVTLDSCLKAREAVERRKQLISFYKSQGYDVLFDKNVGLGSHGVDKHGDDYRKTRDGVKWTYEKVYEIARKYEYLVDFTNQDQKAFKAAEHHNWLKDFTWLKRVRNMKGYRSEYKTRKLVEQHSIDSVDFRDGAFLVDGEVMYGRKI